MNSESILKNNISSIAIGGFDGMHRAHQELFNVLDDNGAIVAIETGYANLSPNKHREDYTSLPIFYYPLEEIKHLHADEFVKLLMQQYPKLEKIVVGYDFHFGTKAKYSTDDLKKLFEGEVIVVDEISYKDIAVHSRIIREFLKNGDIKLANELLNKPYRIKGEVISGQGLGKKQFVPTINLDIQEFLLPKEAIYVTKTRVDDLWYESVSFIGHRITTDGKFAVETHILNKDISVKDPNVAIEFHDRVRDNRKFFEYDDLKQQILKDIEQANNYFK